MRREGSRPALRGLLRLLVALVALAAGHQLGGFPDTWGDVVAAAAVVPVLGTGLDSRRARALRLVSDAPLLDPDAGPREVHVISGSFGAGHDAAAREIAWRLVDAGHRVHLWDVVDLFPARLGPLVRSLYLTQLDVSPRSWGFLLRHLHPDTLLLRAVTALVAALPARRIRQIAASGADLFVSTHPFASQSLGSLRRTGRLTVPAVTYLTDASVHPLWVHTGIDLHLAHLEVAAAQARALGAEVRVVRALVPPACSEPQSPAERDRVLRGAGLPTDVPIALVVGGSLGIGELDQSARDVAATGLALPVVVAGSNAGLVDRLQGVPGVRVLGWRDDLLDLVKAADCVVQNAGGFTSLEALATGTPVVTYRCIPGHGTTNAAALEAAGRVPWPRDERALADDLAAALGSSVGGGPPAGADGSAGLLEVLCESAGRTLDAA